MTAAANFLYFLIMAIKTVARQCKAKWEQIQKAKIRVKEQYKPEEEKKEEEIPQIIEEEKDELSPKTKSPLTDLQLILEELSVQ